MKLKCNGHWAHIKNPSLSCFVTKIKMASVNT